MTRQLLSAYRFFQENASYYLGSRAQSAFDLAKAELWSKDQGYTYLVIDDKAEIDTSWMDAKQRIRYMDGTDQAVGVVMFNADKSPITSVWGLIGADEIDLRVTKAELALEHMTNTYKTLAMSQSF